MGKVEIAGNEQKRKEKEEITGSGNIKDRTREKVEIITGYEQ